MKRLFVLFICLASFLSVQARQLPADSLSPLRVVDSLSARERLERVPILLRSELDSLLQERLDIIQSQTEPKEVAQEEKLGIWPILSAAALGLILLLIYLIWQQQKRAKRSFVRLYKQIQHLDAQVWSGPASLKESEAINSSNTDPRVKAASLTEKIRQLQKENEGLELMLDEYRKSRQDFESLKQQMMEAYKVRHYPGFNKDETESEVLRATLKTERYVAAYAYERFLKPMLKITDANKNNPARISEEDRQKIADSLVSMGLLYTEYLYLRIAELSIGGNMVERIAGLQKGNGIDPQLLKELSTAHGSRALALRITLDKMGITHLSYPVFEETNLNLS